MNLFMNGYFELHSGRWTRWKLECDALTDEDIKTLASMAWNTLERPFTSVVGVPQGGLRLAQAMERFARPSAISSVLIVDDVLTTGASVKRVADLYNEADAVHGLVIFARGRCPYWITPLFTVNERLWDV